ncbi:MAG TPA: hypothetical protein PK080_06025 [Hyphomonadaceae bacterium]|nr:hypothetical protein [Hyphomonadaceae bacterium]
MVLWDSIRLWVGKVGWRRHAPAAGSVVAHCVVGAAVVALMAASGKPERARAPTPPAISVSLIADSAPLPARPLTPRPAPKPKAETADTAPPVSASPRRDGAPTSTNVPQPTPSASNDTAYLGPSPFAQYAPTGGLKGLTNLDPCAPSRYGPRPRECSQLVAKAGSMDSVVPLSKEQMAAQHGEFMPTCAYAVGCEGGEWISTNGTRNVSGTRMAGGVESVGGITDTVGRLGFNPDHFDRGFGN